MEFISRDEEKAVIVAVEGRVDATTAPEFEKYLTGSMGQGKKTLILNLNGLIYISSARAQGCADYSQETQGARRRTDPGRA